MKKNDFFGRNKNENVDNFLSSYSFSMSKDSFEAKFITIIL